MLHGLLILLGITNGSGHAYLFWSGVGSDLGEITLIGGLAAIYRKHGCHALHCWRLGKHPVAGTPYITCRKHHPELPNAPVTAEQIAAHSKERS